MDASTSIKTVLDLFIDQTTLLLHRIFNDWKMTYMLPSLEP